MTTSLLPIHSMVVRTSRGRREKASHLVGIKVRRAFVTSGDGFLYPPHRRGLLLPSFLSGRPCHLAPASPLCSHSAPDLCLFYFLPHRHLQIPKLSEVGVWLHWACRGTGALHLRIETVSPVRQLEMRTIGNRGRRSIVAFLLPPFCIVYLPRRTLQRC